MCQLYKPESYRNLKKIRKLPGKFENLKVTGISKLYGLPTLKPESYRKLKKFWKLSRSQENLKFTGNLKNLKTNQKLKKSWKLPKSQENLKVTEISRKDYRKLKNPESCRNFKTLKLTRNFENLMTIGNLNLLRCQNYNNP
jgi:hypothetical protein